MIRMKRFYLVLLFFVILMVLITYEAFLTAPTMYPGNAVPAFFWRLCR
jgi:hypothetical protein